MSKKVHGGFSAPCTPGVPRIDPVPRSGTSNLSNVLYIMDLSPFCPLYELFDFSLYQTLPISTWRSETDLVVLL